MVVLLVMTDIIHSITQPWAVMIVDSVLLDVHPVPVTLIVLHVAEQITGEQAVNIHVTTARLVANLTVVLVVILPSISITTVL